MAELLRRAVKLQMVLEAKEEAKRAKTWAKSMMDKAGPVLTREITAVLKKFKAGDPEDAPMSKKLDEARAFDGVLSGRLLAQVSGEGRQGGGGVGEEKNGFIAVLW